MPMKKEHFLEYDKNWNPYPFKFENTCLVQQAFEKELLWIEEKCVGKLSKSGLDFVLQNRSQFGPAINHSKPLRWK